MADSLHNERLNDLLIRAYRSLLQYVAECWPWTEVSQESDERALRQMALEQQHGVGRLADLLKGRGWTIDFGVYPTEFTDLHYLALDFLYRQLCSDEEGLIAELEQSRAASAADPEAAHLLADLVTAEKQRLAGLGELSAKHAAAAKS